MATRDWAAEFAAAEQAGVDKEQAEVDKKIAAADARFEKVVEEAMKMVTDGKYDDTRDKRLATSGAAFLQPQVVEVPVQPASPSQEEIDAAAAELRAQAAARIAREQQAAEEARAVAERSVVVPPAPATSTAPVVPSAPARESRVTTITRKVQKSGFGAPVLASLFVALIVWVAWNLLSDAAFGRGGWAHSPFVTFVIVVLCAVGTFFLFYKNEEVVKTESTTNNVPLDDLIGSPTAQA